MDRDGILFAGIPLVTGIILLVLGYWMIALPFFGLAVFMAYFFRDPSRSTPTDKDAVISGADGQVTRIEDRDGKKFVSVFLSPLDVHINRAPIAGKVTDVKLFQGFKKPATSNESSETNERNSVTIQNGDVEVVCTQIVGILARRIVCRVEVGDELEMGQRFGLIRFGSRTDLLMPGTAEVLVKVGDRVKGGETIIARLDKKLD